MRTLEGRGTVRVSPEYFTNLYCCNNIKNRNLTLILHGPAGTQGVL